MARPLSLLANTILFVLCAFLVANIANSVFAALLTPAPAEAATQPTRAPVAERGWEDRQVILARNLFNSSLLVPAGPPPVQEEDLEATRLPLTLLGTVAAEDPQIAWAAIEDIQERKTLVLRTNDTIKPNVTIVRIDRRRVVLDENGTLRELALEDDDGSATRVTARSTASRRVARGNSRRTARARRASDRVRQVAQDRYEVPREEVEEAVRNPGSIFSQAQIQPKYEDGQMLGMQVNAIQEGSLFEEIGMQDGDVITELNGIQISSPEESAKILAEFAQATEFVVVVEGADGPRTLNFTLPEE